MDCNNARLLLEVAHPLASELDARDTAELAGHLADCPDCGPWAQNEHRVDEALGKAMRAVPVPAGLALKIVQRLHVERDAWYRGWAVRAAGIAAALLLMLWGSWAFWLGKKATVDLDRAVVSADTFLYKPELVEEAFAAKGVQMAAPPKFDYSLLASHDMVEFQGRRVPYLLFLKPGVKDSPPAVARVYVLSKKQFTLEQGKEAIAGSKNNVVVLPNEKTPDFFYVVVYPVGSNLSQFFKSAPAGQL